jgi:hypothetical protein
MSRLQYSKECLPVTTIRLGHITAETPEPTHAGCPGGSHRELAVIGGWTCPCVCHQTTANDQAPSVVPNE